MRVTASSIQNYQVTVQAGKHTVRADEPLGVGGDDTAPTPTQLLLSALAGCTIITAHMYANRKGWPLDRVDVTASMEQTSAANCPECTSPPNTRVNLVQLDLVLHGDLDDEQRARIAQIAKRCPVHRTLTAETIIRTTHDQPA